MRRACQVRIFCPRSFGVSEGTVGAVVMQTFHELVTQVPVYQSPVRFFLRLLVERPVDVLGVNQATLDTSLLVMLSIMDA